MQGKFSPRFILPFKIIEMIGKFIYRLQLPSYMSNIYTIFHMSSMMKQINNSWKSVSIDEVEVCRNLRYREEKNGI